MGSGKENDHFIVGATNFLSPTPFFHGRATSVYNLLNGAINEINGNFADAQLIQIRVGWRPTSQDTYPLIGGTSISNLFVGTGTKRNGFHLSPVISKILSAAMVSGTEHSATSIFFPEREPIRDISREDAIVMGVESLISQHYQHGYKPSGLRMDNLIKDGFRQQIEEIHDRAGASEWGIPPELLNMYSRGHVK